MLFCFKGEEKRDYGGIESRKGKLRDEDGVRKRVDIRKGCGLCGIEKLLYIFCYYDYVCFVLRGFCYYIVFCVVVRYWYVYFRRMWEGIR